jgi:MFS family permease
MRAIAGPALRRPLIAAGLLGLLTVGDGFLYLSLQRRDDFAAAMFPLLYVGTNLAYLVLAIPFGRLADRIGRAKVFLGGHVLLLVAYGFAAAPIGGWAWTIASLVLLGAFYAASDGVLAALVSRLVPAESRGTGIASAQTVVALARFASSLLFGALWVGLGRQEALVVVAVALAVAIPVGGWLLRGVER